MDIQEYKKSNRLSEWAEMVSACRNSGQTISAWCEENGINEKTYYYRQKRVCDAMPDLRRNTALPVLRNEPPVSFVKVTPAIRSRTSDTAVTICMGSTEVQIRDGADAATIEAVLRILPGIC